MIIVLKLMELLEFDTTPSISLQEDKTIKQIFNTGKDYSPQIKLLSSRAH